LTENRQSLTLFRATYAANFKEKEFVESTIHQWQNGANYFTLITSGSTGRPKDIRLYRELLIWSAESTKTAIKSSGNETLICCLPVTKTGGFMQLVRSLHLGWQIHFINPQMSSILEHLENSSSYNQTSLTPTQLKTILNNNLETLKSFNDILIGGSPIDKELEEQLKEIGKMTMTTFYETYGMTETASHVALRKVGSDNYFKPQPGVQLSLEDEQLCIAIPRLDFFIKTNDVVKLHPDGFKVLGRSDDVINSGGLKIHPMLLEPEIALVLKESGIERPFYITSQKNKEYGQQAVLVMKGPPVKNKPHLLEILKRALPAYHNPKNIIFVDAIEYTDTGKIKRLTL